MCIRDSLKAFQPQRAHVLLERDLGCHVLGAHDFLHLRGAMHMVEQGAHAIEAHRAEELLVVVVPLRALVDGVPLVRDVAEGVVRCV